MADDFKDFQKIIKALAGNRDLLLAQEETTDAIEKLNATMANHFEYLKRQEKDKREEKLETSKAKNQQQQQAGGSVTNNNSKIGLLGLFGGIKGIGAMLLPLTAGIAAVAAAFAGLRGWELSAIKKINGMVKVPLTMSNGLIRMRNAAFAMFGLTPEGLLTRDAKGRFQRAAPITTQIGMRMNALRIRALRMFGIGADGKLIATKGGDGLFKKNIIGKATSRIGDLLSPIADVSKAITGYMSGGGKALFTWIGTLAKGSVGWLSVIGKILKPIGFIFSIKAAYDDFVSSDKTSLLEKSTDAIGAFFGDFIGAPIELLKDLLSGAFKLIGWDDEAKALDDIDLVKGITKAFQDVLDIPRELFNWVGTLFSDPAKAGQMAWDTFLEGLGLVGGTYSTLVDIMLWPVNKFFNWVGELLGWKDPDSEDMDIRATVTGWVTDFFDWFAGFLPDISKIASDLTQTITGLLPQWMQDSLGLSGPDTNPEELAAIAADQDRIRKVELVKTLMAADANGDGTLTKAEALKFDKFGMGKNSELAKAINELDDLRGGTLGQAGNLMQGYSLIINNVDNSTTAPVVASASATPFSVEATGAIDEYTAKKIQLHDLIAGNGMKQ